MTKQVHGHTKSGKPVTDEMIEGLAAAAGVESVRLDPERFFGIERVPAVSG
ncbi:MAG: hypothetical protein ACKO1Y_09180 [Actinomycetota bacterium]